MKKESTTHSDTTSYQHILPRGLSERQVQEEILEELRLIHKTLKKIHNVVNPSIKDIIL